MNSQKRVLLALVGIVFIAYAIYAHLLLPGIVLLVVIFVSAMFLLAGLRGRI